MNIIELADLIWGICACLFWLVVLVAFVVYFVNTYRLPKKPCQVGDALFVVRESDDGNFFIEKVRVSHFILKENGDYIVTVNDEDYFESYLFDLFNEMIFSSESLAKREIKMMKG